MPSRPPLKRRRVAVSVFIKSCLALLITAVSMPTASFAENAFAEADPVKQAGEVLLKTQVTGGLIVHVGVGDGKLTAALGAGEGFLVQGLDTDAAKVAAARKRIHAMGKYGPIAVSQFDGKRLPMVDNSVNLLVSESLGDIPTNEVMRVLTPLGVAYIKQDGKWVLTKKAWPKNIDDWTHYLHDASGNAVADDDVVAPPKHLQWIGGPRWSRHHDRMASMSALVTARGKMFYIMDEGSRVSIQLPPDWKLIARDAFNGVLLWKVPIKEWHSHLWPLKSGPTQLARRLVATHDKVFVTTGIREPLRALDAATGRTLWTCEESAATEEILHVGDTVLALANKGESELAKYSPKFNVGDQRRVRTEFGWNKKPRIVMAIEAETGKVRWQKETAVAPLTMASDPQRVYIHDGQKVVCFSLESGSKLWETPASRKGFISFNFGPKLVVHKDIVLFAGGDRKMVALDSTTGKKLWDAPHARGGYESPEDLIVTGGKVWSAPLYSGRDSGAFTGRDVRTGEVKVEFKPNVDTYWFHHRCYIAKATKNFLLPSRTGIEFVDYNKQDWDIHHWVRGGCLYGVMPANGLLYSSPHNCACYPEAKIYGFNALAPPAATRPVNKVDESQPRLMRGPAFGKVETQQPGDGDWPTYRQDNQRSGSTKTTTPASLKPAWRTKIASRPGDKLSAATVANGKLFVSDIHAHTVHALNANTGEKVWHYTAGGRVDSPPTIHNGLAIFGCTDGHVYALRASDGELAWRFRVAAKDIRLTSFNQVESVWPVHGSALVQGGHLYVIAGRSTFLDGGLRFVKLNAETGELVAEKVIDDQDPKTGKDIQDRIATLQMPVGLPDILASDGKRVYMRSQVFDFEGNRVEFGPHSGNAPVHGAVQKGDTSHLFSPTGFLDDSWFHRSYWVFGRSFAGGHNGYYQAGKNAPSGRLLVHDDQSVFGFGRKPQYLKWTTPLEHQLFSAPRSQVEGDTQTASDIAAPAAKGNRKPAGKSTGPIVEFAMAKSLNPQGKALAVEAWVNASKPGGVVLARGGPQDGFALLLDKGLASFAVRSDTKLSVIRSKRAVVGRWVHLVGVLRADKTMTLYVDGKPSSHGKAPGLLASDPKQAMEVGGDAMSAVGNYTSPYTFGGVIDEVRLYYGELTDDEIAHRFAKPDDFKPSKAKVVLDCTFDRGTPRDASGMNHHGSAKGTRVVEGKNRRALQFVPVATKGRKGGNRNNAAYKVKHDWTRDVPLFVMAIAKAGDTLLIAGPPDIMDEEKTFAALTRDAAKEVSGKLLEQDRILDGSRGSILLAISPKDGRTLLRAELDALPVFDGMAVANQRVYIVTRTGEIVCLGSE